MISSIIEQDMYKLTMGQVIHFLFPSVEVEYKFINRGKTPFPEGFDKALQVEVDKCADLKILKGEECYLKTLYFLSSVYVDFLKNFKYNPSQVSISQKGGNLNIDIKGSWKTAIFWEVTLMAIISELYFKMTNQKPQERFIRESNNISKINELSEIGAKFVDFGMRRRYSAKNHREVLEDFIANNAKRSLIGTSNVKYAMDYDIKPIGTMAHEFIMGESALRSLRYANKYSMEDWSRIYRGDLGIVLTDTFGLDAFLDDFDKGFAKQFDGVRHDSGDPKLFTDRIIAHYKYLGINPLHKTIIFSDGLDVEEIKNLFNYCKNKIQCSFGIGTNLTNDVGVKPLNMVIKLFKVNGIPVVKLSDVASKATGDSKAIDVAKWTFGLGEYE